MSVLGRTLTLVATDDLVRSPPVDACREGKEHAETDEHREISRLVNTGEIAAEEDSEPDQVDRCPDHSMALHRVRMADQHNVCNGSKSDTSGVRPAAASAG